MVSNGNEFHEKWMIFQAVSDLDAVIVKFRGLGYPEWAQKLADTQAEFLSFIKDDAGSGK